MTIPDSLAADLRDLYISSPPLELPATSIRLKLETDDMPSPRLVILPGEPAKVLGMIATARLPFSMEYITSMDSVPPETHRTSSDLIDVWLRGLRATCRRAVLSSRIYLHDLYSLHPTYSIRAEEREQVATLRGEAIVTLAITEP